VATCTRKRVLTSMRPCEHSDLTASLQNREEDMSAAQASLSAGLLRQPKSTRTPAPKIHGLRTQRKGSAKASQRFAPRICIAPKWTIDTSSIARRPNPDSRIRTCSITHHWADRRAHGCPGASLFDFCDDHSTHFSHLMGRKEP